MHLPQTSVIHSRNVGCPGRPGGNKQASAALFRANAEEVSPATGLAGRLRDGHVGRRRRQGKIAFAFPPLLPIAIVALLWFGHCYYSVTRRDLDACY